MRAAESAAPEFAFPTSRARFTGVSQMRTLPRWVLMLLAAAGFVGMASLSACNTVEGVGEDTQEAGEAIEETAEDVGD
jgi:predicted small secreted protein